MKYPFHKGLFLLFISVVLGTTPSAIMACEHHNAVNTMPPENTSKPSDHAPVGVMGDHLHKKGSWMLGYRYQESGASGLKKNNDTVSSSQALHEYGEAHDDMIMKMHMLELMYGVTDDLTLMVMPQYMEMEMTHLSHGHHGSHQHELDGFGDTEVSALYSVFRSPKNAPTRHKLHLNMGLSVPTGSIEETFTNHHGTVLPLPYAMQLGSGTFDPIIGATYTGFNDGWSWGFQNLNTLRMGKNDEGYRLGNKYQATAWVAKDVANLFNVSARLQGEAWDDVSGLNKKLPITSIVGANPNQQAGERVFAYVGLNLLGQPDMGVISHQRLGLEFGLPIHERYSGYGIQSDYRLMLSWQMSY